MLWQLPVQLIMAIVLFEPVRRNGLLHRSQYVVLLILATILSAHNQSFRPLYFYSRFGRVAIVLHRFIVRNCDTGFDFDRRNSRACMNDQLMTVSAHVYVSSSLHSYYHLLHPAGLPVYQWCSHHSQCSAMIALLLLIDNVEPNPGPQSQAVINFGLISVRSAVNKAVLIHDVMSDYHLDLAAVTETWTFSDEPDAVAPAGFRVLHTCHG